MRLSSSDHHVVGPGVRFRVRHPVLAAHLIGERVFVIYDWMAFDKDAPARNLFCYDRTGTELWRAEDIGMGEADAYTNVTQELPLWAGNFVGCECRIDEASGKVLETCFTK